MNAAIERLLAIARAEIGYHEKQTSANLDSHTAPNDGVRNYTKYARDLAQAGYYQASKQGYDWCDMFCDWCFLHLCGSKDLAERVQCQTGPYGAGCDWSARYYKEQGRLVYGDPQPGDQVFFRDYAHTGLVEAVRDGYVYTIEGNSSNCVAARRYALTDSQLTAYGRPRYELVPDDADGRPVFRDVPDGAWYAEAVHWAVDNDITDGIGGDLFGPDLICTRAQAVTMLWRMQGSPEPEGSYNPFADVPHGCWHEMPVIWALESGITAGIGPREFGADQVCTRAQIATMLYSLAGSPRQELPDFDFGWGGPGDYFFQSMLWASRSGIVAGTGDGDLAPRMPCTRAMIVQMLHAYSKL